MPLLFVSCAWNTVAQDAPPVHLVHDWSNHYIVFTALAPENLSHAIHADPRAWHSWVQHARHRFEGPSREEGKRPVRPFPHGRHPRALAVDWQMPIGTSAGPLASPAKFGFDANAAPDCANDYVVFPTGNVPTPGTSGQGVQATVIASNNLYTGPGPTGICPTPVAPAAQPSVPSAYNTATTTAGKAALSPVLSLDGKKIALVESNDGFTNTYTAFHVLTWKAGEGAGWDAAATPGDCYPGNSCMTTLLLNTIHCDSHSSPFVDYAHDTAYVGDDGGMLHKITPVFNGVPAEVIGNGWPVQRDLSTQPARVQSPVYDSISGRIFVTDYDGEHWAFYAVDAASGAILSTMFPTQGPYLNSVSDPLVDSTNQTVFLFFAAYSSFHLTVWQLDTGFQILHQVDVLAPVYRDRNVFAGAFDNNYFSDPSSGSLYFAASINDVATLYRVGFTGKTMNAAFSDPLALTTSSSTSVPTPLTEFFNPAFSTAPDRLFLGIDANCTGTNPDANGCIESFDITNGFPSGILNAQPLATGGAYLNVSGLIVDNLSSLAQASSMYFEAVSPPVGTPASAFKLTQSSLQ
jgi:hypothetical protein